MAFEVDRARAWFERGLGLAALVHGRLRREVRLFAHGGLAVLARIEETGYDVFTRRATLRRGDLLRLVLRELWAA
jgi:phytoene synthase